MDWKKIGIISGIVIICLSASFIGGCTFQKSKYNTTIVEYQDTIDQLGESIKGLRDRNTEITELNNSARARLKKLEGELDGYINRLGGAESALDKIGTGLSESGSTISGLIDAVERIIQAIAEYEDST